MYPYIHLFKAQKDEKTPKYIGRATNINFQGTRSRLYKGCPMPGMEK
jgi:hypothetical protein